jgi:hypothetical protein
VENNPINGTDPFGLYCRIEGVPGLGPRVGDTWIEAQKTGFENAVVRRLAWEIFKLISFDLIPPVPDRVEDRLSAFMYRVRYTEYEWLLVVTKEFYVCYDDCMGEESFREYIGSSDFGKKQRSIVRAYEVKKFVFVNGEFDPNNKVDPFVVGY